MLATAGVLGTVGKGSAELATRVLDGNGTSMPGVAGTNLGFVDGAGTSTAGVGGTNDAIALNTTV